MDKKTIFSKNNLVRMKNVGGIKILIRMDTLEIFEYSAFGRDILDLINGKRDVSEILKILKKRKRYQTQDIDKDVLNFLYSELKNKVIIKIKNRLI